MNKERLTAFSGGVIAIIITIMVLELKAPDGTGWAALAGMLPVFLWQFLSVRPIAMKWSVAPSRSVTQIVHASRPQTGLSARYAPLV